MTWIYFNIKIFIYFVFCLNIHFTHFSFIRFILFIADVVHSFLFVCYSYFIFIFCIGGKFLFYIYNLLSISIIIFFFININGTSHINRYIINIIMNWIFELRHKNGIGDHMECVGVATWTNYSVESILRQTDRQMRLDI